MRAAEDAIAAGYPVISDVNMPHLDGFEFIQALKAGKTIPDMPVIFSHLGGRGHERGEGLGTVGYLRKPVLADTLLPVVAQHPSGGRIPIA